MTAKEKELVDQLITFMDCPCRIFEPMEDDDPIQEAYREAKERGRSEGFTPILLGAEEMLLEDIMYNCGSEDPKNMDMVRAARKKFLEESLSETFSEGMLDWMQDDLKKLKENSEMVKEAMDESAEGELVDGFSSYWDFTTQATLPVILAEVPVEKPWQVFAWLRVGGWNEFPGPETLMVLSKQWFEKYGAVPAAAIHDILEFTLEKPVIDRKAAAELAMEQYVFCCDRVEQAGENETLGTLADSLTKSKFWFFWWD